MASDVIVTAYRVGYLGSCPAISTAHGLAMVQQALRDLYLGKSTKFGSSREEVQKPRTLEITAFGLAVKHEEMRTKTGNIVEVTEMLSPFTTIMLWAALRFVAKKVGKHRKKKLECAFLPLICTDFNLETSMFAPLDNKYSFVTKVKHPALFTCVLRHPEAPRVMECHAFVCRSHSDALEIAWNLHEALMQYTKIRRLTKIPIDSFGLSSTHSEIPLVSPSGRLQRLEDPMRSSLSSKKCTGMNYSKKNTVVFADVCTESSGRGSASSGSESADDEGTKSEVESKIASYSPMKQQSQNYQVSPSNYRKLEDTTLQVPTKSSNYSSSPRPSTPSRSDMSEMNLDWHTRHKIFGGVRVLPPGKPPTRPSSAEGPDILSHVPYAESPVSSSNISSQRYERKPNLKKSHLSSSNYSPIAGRRAQSMHELAEIDLRGSPTRDRLQLPAENLTRRIYREKKTFEETRTNNKKNVKAKEHKFPMIKLKKWRQRDSSLDRDSDSRETESALSFGLVPSRSEVTQPRLSRKDGVYRDGDSWKKYYWKDNRDLDLEKTMYAPDWDVRRYRNYSPDSRRTNPHISWSRTNLESSLGYIP